MSVRFGIGVILLGDEMCEARVNNDVTRYGESADGAAYMG
jgi:hypothetical protein